MGNLASLTFMLGADIRSFQTNMRKASQTLSKVGKDMKSIGKNVSMYATAPIMGMAAVSVAAFDKQAQAEQKLATQIRANGKDVESTLESYKRFATELQSITIVGDETTLGLIQMAETMGSSNVMEATKGAIGLSKALGVDLQSAIKMVTLAEKGEYTMLNRYVPALRLATTESEKAAIVQKLYADGMKIAAAEAKTGLGPLKQLQNTIGDISEEFGGIIAEAIQPAVEWLKKMAAQFQGLSDKGKRTIAIVAGIVAAIGPMLLILGTLLTVLPAIGAALAALTGPVGLVVAAIAAIAAAFVYVYGNFEAFKERLTNWAWLKNALIDAAVFIAKMATVMWRPLLDALGIDFVTPAIEKLKEFKGEVEPMKTEFKSFGQTMKDVGSEVMTALGLMGDSGKESFKKIEGGIKSTNAALGTLKTSIETMGSKSGGGVAVDMTPEIIIDEGKMNASMTAAEIKYLTRVQKFRKTATEAWSSLGQSIQNAIAGLITELGVLVGEALGDMISGIDPNFGASVLNAVGGFLKQLGTAMIAYGALLVAMYIAGSSGPWGAAAAIVIGIAAVAAGQLLMNQASAGPAMMADGGIVPSGFPGDTYPALLSSGETVLPSPIPLGSMAGGGDVNVSVSGRLRGYDLIISGEKASRKRSRITGR